MRLIAMLMSILLPGAASAQATCFAYTAPDGAGSEIAELTWHEDGLFQFTLPGAPYAVFSGICPVDETGNGTCQVECDGGNMTLARADGTMQIVFNRYRVEELRIETLTFGHASFDADGLTINGSYRLTPVGPAICNALSARAQPLTLVPGDYYPAVSRIERALAVAGHFAEVPDFLFTRETAEAVRRFQIQAGLPANGEADWEFLRLLGVQVTYGGGGC